MAFKAHSSPRRAAFVDDAILFALCGIQTVPKNLYSSVRRQGGQMWGKLRSRALRWWDACGGAHTAVS
jgi:hypothetical protein